MRSTLRSPTIHGAGAFDRDLVSAVRRHARVFRIVECWNGGVARSFTGDSSISLSPERVA